MAMTFRINTALASLAGLLLMSCGQPDAPETAAAPTIAKAAPADAPSLESAAPAWPAGLRVMGDGFPEPGSPCRRLGETDLTVNYLDDSAVLVGCPGGPDSSAAQAIVGTRKGRVVGSLAGVTLLSIPFGDANVGLNQPEAERK